VLVDSHCHLDFEDFAGQRDAVIARAKEAGVGLMVTIGTRVAKFAEVRAIAERYETVYCSVGTHPHHAAEEAGVRADQLIKLAAHPKVVAIGETGLDYHYEHSPRDAQQALFRQHIAAARQTGLPLIVHSRNADRDTGDILAEEMAKGPFKGLIHCFSSGQQLAEKAVKLGIYISLSGIFTFKNASAVREAVRAVPLDRLLVETDAPYLAPAPMRGKRNEPAFTAHTAAAAADFFGLEMEDFARRTTANFFRLFDKAALPGPGAHPGQGAHPGPGGAP